MADSIHRPYLKKIVKESDHSHPVPQIFQKEVEHRVNTFIGQKLLNSNDTAGYNLSERKIELAREIVTLY